MAAEEEQIPQIAGWLQSAGTPIQSQQGIPFLLEDAFIGIVLGSSKGSQRED
ncbi:MAG: hypothetical protein SNJ85_02055 [Cyanobacteriota bacterium]